uniref:Uncharacterized protein n=1 Tax=Cannabis sativa TaxID=3483 RepID=A0A803P6X3_CANSA
MASHDNTSSSAAQIDPSPAITIATPPLRNAIKYFYQLHGQSSQVRMGALSISDHVEKVHSLFDSIVITGSTTSGQNVILQLLNDLGLEYDSVFSSITSRSDVLTLEEV